MSAIRRLNPLESYQVLQSDPEAVLIDVRTTAELKFVGFPVNAIHLPWMEFPEMKPLDGFVERVQERVNDKSRTLLLICRSGQRSMNAAKALEAAGFTDLVNVEEGFEGDLDEQGHRNNKGGWRFNQLPWAQK